MKNNVNHSTQNKIDYIIDTATESLTEERVKEVTGEVNIHKEYGLAKPVRRLVRAKIFSE